MSRMIYGQTQLVSTQMPHLGAELDRVEALTVAELARRVHADGYRFVGWPTVSRHWIGYRARYDFTSPEVVLAPGSAEAWHVRIELEVAAEER